MADKPHKSVRKRRQTKRDAADAPRSRLANYDAVALAGVLLATLVVYLRCLSNGFVFDDHEMIVANRFIGDWSFFWKSIVNDSWWFRDPLHLPQSSYYRPLQDIWLGLNYRLFGLQPPGWHATMVLLHLLAVVLVFKVASILTGHRLSGLLAALLFGLFPAHAEAVVWPAAIPEPMAGLFELAAFYFFIRRAGVPGSNTAWALMLFAAALLSHESAIAFPGLIAVYVLIFDDAASIPPPKGNAPGPPALAGRLGKAIVRTAPFVAVTLGYLALRLWVLGFISRPNPESHATIAQVLMTIPAVAANYLTVLALPWMAGPSHRVDFVRSAGSPDFYLPLAALGLLAAALVLILKHSSRRRLYIFCAAWTIIGLAPVMNLGGLFHEALVQDRYLYLPSIGLCLALADLAVGFASGNAARRTPVAIGVAAVALTYAVTLWGTQHFWHDEVTLFSRCVELYPDSAIYHNRLGMAYQERGNLVAAERELATSLALSPDDGVTLYDLGLVHQRLGRNDEAAKEMARGLALLPNAPADAYVNAARLYDAIGQARESEAAFKRAEALPGGMRAAALARARIKLAHQDGAGAERVVRAALERAPDDLDLIVALGGALGTQRRYEEALAEYRRAIALAPSDPALRFLTAFTLHNLGRDEDALVQCRVILAASPGDANARWLMQQIQKSTSKGAMTQ
jgi:tetratricopeptide (TPR) repeat protein